MKLTYIIAFLGLVACQPKKENNELVKNIGQLRQIMHQGQFEARVLMDTLDKSNLYAVGALEKLSGELTIIDGQVYATQVQNDSIQQIPVSETKATLFVYSRVEEWDTIHIISSVDLEQTITETAVSRNLLKPFPFLVKGIPNTATYHVINFDSDNGDISRHKEGAKYDTLTNESVQLLGFYATDAKGVYTHHTTNMHVHLVDQTGLKAGHLEAVDFTDTSFRLLIPKR